MFEIGRKLQVFFRNQQTNTTERTDSAPLLPITNLIQTVYLTNQPGFYLAVSQKQKTANHFLGFGVLNAAS